MDKKYKNKIIRIIYVIIGLSILSIGLSFMRYAVFGVDPIVCLNIGIANKLGITFGLWQIIMCLILLIFIYIFDRSKIGFGTLYVMIVGYKSDFVLWLIEQIPFLEIYPLQIRIIAFTLGIFILYFGAAIYIEANMGISPYDAIAIIIAEKIKKENWFKWIRIGTDSLCVIGGILLKSDVGIGTLISVLVGGPLIAFYRKYFKILSIENKNIDIK